jgi:hypothetical protein
MNEKKSNEEHIIYFEDLIDNIAIELDEDNDIWDTNDYYSIKEIYNWRDRYEDNNDSKH